MTILKDLILETSDIENQLYSGMIEKSVFDIVDILNDYCLYTLRIGYKITYDKNIVIDIHDDLTYIKFFKLLKFIYEEGYKINKVEIETLLNKSKKLDWNIFCEYYCNEQNFNMLKNLKLCIV